MNKPTIKTSVLLGNGFGVFMEHSMSDGSTWTSDLDGTNWAQKISPTTFFNEKFQEHDK